MIRVQWRKDSILLRRSWMCCSTGWRNLCSGNQRSVPDGGQKLVDADKPLPEATEQMTEMSDLERRPPSEIPLSEDTEQMSDLDRRPLLCVGTLPAAFTDFDVRDLFGKKVKLRDVYMQRDDNGKKTGFGFVRCDSMQAAKELIRYFRETPVSSRQERMRKDIKVVLHAEREFEYLPNEEKTHRNVLKLFNVPPTEDVRKVKRLFERADAVTGVLGRREYKAGQWRHVVYVSLRDVDLLMEARNSVDRSEVARRVIFARNLWEPDPPLSDEEIQFNRVLEEPREFTRELQDTLEQMFNLSPSVRAEMKRNAKWKPSALRAEMIQRNAERRRSSEMKREAEKIRIAEKKLNAETENHAQQKLRGAAGESAEQERKESPDPAERGRNTSAKPVEPEGYESREPVEQELNDGPDKHDARSTVS